MPSLQAFESAARHLSFARAAAELGRTPSAISHAIKDMETRLGVALFERSGRSINLSAAGAEFFVPVQQSLQTLTHATRLQKRRREESIVRISALPFFTSAVLLPNLTKFEATNPHLELRIETSSAYADLVNGEADIAIRFGATDDDALLSEQLIAIRGQPIASPDYLFRSGTPKTVSDLEQHTLLHVRPNSDAWRSWGAANGVSNLSGTHQLVFESILGAIDAAKAGLGVALAMDPLIRRYPGYGDTFLPVLSASGHSQFGYNFVCLKSRYHDQKIQRTLKWLRAALV